MTPGTYNLQLQRGLPHVIELELQNPSNPAAVDLTGCSARATLGGTGNPELLILGCAIIGTNQVRVTVSKEQTASLPGTLYKWALLVTDTLGIEHSLLTGTVSVEKIPL